MEIKWEIFGHKKTPTFLSGFQKWATTYSTAFWAVPSAKAVLTSLFGMGRGEPRFYSHPKMD